jgi:hypothetical protein
MWCQDAREQVRIVARSTHAPVPYESRSHLGDGRVAVWRPVGLPQGRGFAIDAERRDRLVPTHLAARLGREPDFWRGWTRLEVGCKLTDVPVVLVVTGAVAPPSAGLELCSFDLDGVAVTVGVGQT